MSLGFPTSFGFQASPGNYKAGVWEEKGTTPGGQVWHAKVVNCQDREDNDTTTTFTIADLCFTESDDCGRDWASQAVTVSHPKVAGRISSKVAWGRGGGSERNEDGNNNQTTQLRSIVASMAATEGTTPADFARQLPKGFGSLLLENKIVD